MVPDCWPSACTAPGRSQIAARINMSWTKLVGIDSANRLVWSKPNVPISSKVVTTNISQKTLMPIQRCQCCARASLIGKTRISDDCGTPRLGGSRKARVTIMAAHVTMATER